MPDSQMNFRIDNDLRERFKEKALRSGTNSARLLLQWIEAYVAGEDLSIQSSLTSLGSIDNLDSRIDSRIAELENRLKERIETVLGELSA